MPLSDLPHGELPRERLLAHGAAVLSDAELLAVLLRTGRTGEHVLDLARGIVAQFREEGLAAILRMPAAEFARIPGIGGAKAATVLAALELGRRAYAGTHGMPHMNEAADVMTLLSARCHAERREHFFVLPLSAKNELLMLADVSTGTLTNALVHPREVFEPAIRCGAAHVIVAHNHPSGDPTPSAEDHRLTRSLYEAGKLLKELLREEGRSISVSGSPRAIIKEAYLCFDFLAEDVWLDMLHARNDLTHIYNSTRAEEMVREILTRYIPAFDAMEQGLREQNGEPISHEG